MIFKNGDRVRVISLKKLNKHEQISSGGDYRVSGLLFNATMLQYCGRVFEIRYKENLNGYYKLIGIEKDTEKPEWFFSEHMLTLVDSRLREKLAMKQEFDKELL